MNRTRFAMGTTASIVVLALVGCVDTARESARDEDLPSAAALPEGSMKQQGIALAGRAKDANDTGLGGGESIASTSTGLNRKIIYNASVELAVEEFAGVPDRVVALVKKFDAYVASSSLSGSTGENRHGRWTIRVPVARFEEFVNATKGLGELVNVGTNSRDVSEEYYDVEARIRNKTKEEERLLKLLEDRPGKLEDVIAIERELSRVREDLERMQGRMRVLADLTSLTSVELSILEIRNYQPAEAPTLATRVRRAFEGSATGLQTAGEGLLVGAAAIAPWIPLVAVVVVLSWFMVRRMQRRSPTASP